MHVVRNRAEWPLGGVGVEFEVVAECEYTSDGPKVRHSASLPVYSGFVWVRIEQQGCGSRLD